MSETVPVPQFTPPVVDDEGIADFTVERKRLRFRIDQDVFEAASAVPANILMELMDLQGQIDRIQAEGSNKEEREAFFREFFGRVLLQDSLDLFISRLSDKTKPIDLRQMSNVIGWLFQEYTSGIPFEQRQGSSDGSGPGQGDGTNLTGAVSSQASTSNDSQPIAS